MSNLVPKNNTQGEKVVLAYSGGLDTTCIVPWLKETFGYEVICCCVDVGQGNELDGLAERAKISGASKLYIEDITDDFCDNYVLPCLEANATYENKYLLGTSMARPAIAKKLVEIARKEGAKAICHGATGKGNDQIRFELAIKALAPDLDIIAPWRTTDIWTFQSREDEYNYIKSKGIPLTFSEDNSYSRDRNLVHISHEGLELEDPSQEPNYDHMLMLSVTVGSVIAKKHKVLAAVGTYYAIQVAMSIAEALTMTSVVMLDGVGYAFNVFSASLLLMLAVTVGGYFLMHYLADKKLNLT